MVARELCEQGEDDGVDRAELLTGQFGDLGDVLNGDVVGSEGVMPTRAVGKVLAAPAELVQPGRLPDVPVAGRTTPVGRLALDQLRRDLDARSRSGCSSPHA